LAQGNESQRSELNFSSSIRYLSQTKILAKTLHKNRVVNLKSITGLGSETLPPKIKVKCNIIEVRRRVRVREGLMS